MQDYNWPGNVRQLAHCIERAAIFCDEERIESHHLPSELNRPGAQTMEAGLDLGQRLSRLERRLIEQALVDSTANKSRAAKLLGISRPTLDKKLALYGIKL